MIRTLGAAALLTFLTSPLSGQTPQPFPQPGGRAGAAPVERVADLTAEAAQQQQEPAPTAASLGFPLYPAAQFLGSYDAGGFGQRYYLFGTTAPFNDIVTFYRAMLGTRGNLVFREPPTHMFEVGRFREDAMMFPPGVTVKDWTWESRGYPNPQPGAQPERFPTVIMVVPPPPQ